MRPKANPGTDGGGGGRHRRPRRTAWCASILLVVTTLVAINTVGGILRSAPERETTDHTNRRDAPVLTNSHHSDELATTHRLTTNDDRVLSLQISNIAISNNNSNNNMVISNIATNNNNNSNNNMDICHNHTWNGNFGNFPNTKYQLGDIIKFYKGELEEKYQLKNGIRPCRLFNNSIACSYIRSYRENGQHPNIDVLNEVTPMVEPRPEAVMHLRLGDVARFGDCWVHPCRKGGRLYQFTKDDYDTVRDELKNLTTTITIVANPGHKAGDVARQYSANYLENVMGYLRSIGVCPEYRGIRNADDDFAFAASAKVFVRGGGGYSKFMAELVRKRGGKVLTPNLRFN